MAGVNSECNPFLTSNTHRITNITYTGCPSWLVVFNAKVVADSMAASGKWVLPTAQGSLSEWRLAANPTPQQLLEEKEAGMQRFSLDTGE